MAAGVDEAGEAIDVTAETGTIVKQAVEPPEVGVDEFDHVADVEHGKQCAGADDCPGPRAEEAVARDDS